MKKILCISLIVLCMLCVFTGCSGTAYTTNGNGRTRDYENYANSRQSGHSNVSTSKDGTVNGRNNNSMPRMGMDVEIGPGVR